MLINKICVISLKRHTSLLHWTLFISIMKSIYFPSMTISNLLGQVSSISSIAYTQIDICIYTYGILKNMLLFENTLIRFILWGRESFTVRCISTPVTGYATPVITTVHTSQIHSWRSRFSKILPTLIRHTLPHTFALTHLLHLPSEKLKPTGM